MGDKKRLLHAPSLKFKILPTLIGTRGRENMYVDDSLGEMKHWFVTVSCTPLIGILDTYHQEKPQKGIANFLLKEKAAIPVEKFF